MTTKSGARVYRGGPRDVIPRGACAQCGRVVAITVTGKRRSHLGKDRRPCPGGRVFVEGYMPTVHLDELPDVDLDYVAPRYVPRNPRPKPPDPRMCVCGWRPRRKRNGMFAAHRIEPDNPAAPYCANGSPKTG